MPWLIALIIRIFFRRAVVVGAERIPSDRPILLVVNHPNALVDPLLVLALVPRRVIFLAKEPLFRMPGVGAMVRAMGCIPVYRRQDAADTSNNRGTFAQVGRVLGADGAIALFPEGTSHSDASLRPLKTGAARMALEAAASGADVVIVPAGVYYTDKAIFRSSALLTIGEPTAVPATATLPDGSFPVEAVHQLTATIDTALRQVTLQADAQEARDIVVRAERIFSAADAEPHRERNLAAQFALRQRFLHGYAALRARDPQRLARLVALVQRVDTDLEELGLSPESALGRANTPGGKWSHLVRSVIAILLLAPLGLPGAMLHYPAYRLTGTIITRAVTVEPDVVATGKLLTAMLLFPLTWLLAASWAGWRLGVIAAAIVLLTTPVSGYAALMLAERVGQLLAETRGAVLRLLRRRTFRRIEAGRERIRTEILDLADSVSS